jgi:hypothetical protein
VLIGARTKDINGLQHDYERSAKQRDALKTGLTNTIGYNRRDCASFFHVAFHKSAARIFARRTWISAKTFT